MSKPAFGSLDWNLSILYRAPSGHPSAKQCHCGPWREGGFDVCRHQHRGLQSNLAEERQRCRTGRPSTDAALGQPLPGAQDGEGHGCWGVPVPGCQRRRVIRCVRFPYSARYCADDDFRGIVSSCRFLWSLFPQVGWRGTVSAQTITVWMVECLWILSCRSKADSPGN